MCGRWIRYTVEFTLKEPFGSFPDQPGDSDCAQGRGCRSARRAVGTGPYRFVSFAVDDRVVLAPYEGYMDGAPSNGGVVIKVVPDDTMRGLELRKGGVDLVVNDLAPDIVHQLRGDPALQVVDGPGTDYAYVGINLRDPVLQGRACSSGAGLRRGPRRHRHAPAPWAGAPGSRHPAADVVGVHPGRGGLPLRPGQGRRVARRGGLSGSRRRRSDRRDCT